MNPLNRGRPRRGQVTLIPASFIFSDSRKVSVSYRHVSTLITPKDVFIPSREKQ